MIVYNLTKALIIYVDYHTKIVDFLSNVNHFLLVIYKLLFPKIPSRFLLIYDLALLKIQ